MNKLDVLFEAVNHRWATDGIRRVRRASTVDIDACEARLGLRLPLDMKAFYTALGGMEPGESDRNFIRFWPIDEIAVLSDVVPTDEYLGVNAVAFADWSIGALYYAVHLDPDLGSVVEVGPPARNVGRSFSEFLQHYLRGEVQHL